MRRTLFLKSVRPRTKRAPLIALLASISMLATTFIVSDGQPARAVEPCATGSNVVACENSKPGNDPAEWDIAGAGDPSIQGFSTDISVNVGTRIDFKVDTTASAYTVEIFRTGWYQGLGARKVGAVTPSASLPQRQPNCVSDTATELYDCGTWGVSASWDVPADAVSGVYVALLRRGDTGGVSHITFVVRNEASRAAVLFQTSDPTWHAYNTYGGSNFYRGAANGRAYKASYNRPFSTRGQSNGRDFYFSSEFAQVRFLEKNGYDVTYYSGVDTDRLGAGLLNHAIFLSVGHDEYWSGRQRANVEAARDAGVNMQFLSGNEVYWRTRLEPSVDGSNTANRTVVCYKETWSNKKIDPSAEWTGTWRDPRFAAPTNGAGVPENGLTGTQYQSNNSDLPITVTAAEGETRLWRNTSLTNLAAGTSQALAEHTVGYESNEDVANGFRPPGLIRLSTTIGSVPQYLQDFGNRVSTGTTSHNVTLYRAASGALVFSAGSIQWAWGLDQTHDGNGAPADVRMQQAQVNLLADMGAQPMTLDTALVAATASSDRTAPTTTITSPSTGTAIANGVSVTLTGTAADSGGIVAGVEVSVDGGASWNLATGTTSWSFSYVQHGFENQTVRARAIDDSANFSANPATVTHSSTGPYSVLGVESPAVANAGDPTAVELGLQFTPTVTGSVTGVRFFKSSENTGTHTGSLWDADGNRLAAVTFTNETGSGWQSAAFEAPTAVNAGQKYTVSYYSPSGGYSATRSYWAYRGDARGPLTVVGGFGAAPAGVYNTNGTFPTNSFGGANYYVDALFTPGATPTPTPTPTPNPPGSVTLFGSETPTTASASDKSATEVGTTFTTSQGGTVSAIRFYKGFGNSGTHTGTLWSAAGASLASVTFTNETETGWQTAQLATPVSLTAGTNYTVSYFAPFGRYSVTAGYFSAAKTSGPLTAPVTNGKYRYGSAGGFPTATYGSSNYFVDVVFNPITTTPAPPPTPVPAGAVSLFGTETPTTATAADTSSVELGVAFTPAAAGTVTAIRFFKGSGNGGTHTGNLWSTAGVKLATVTFANETASGWQTAQLATPVTLTAGTSYTVSYLAPQGRYSVTAAYFSTAKTSGPLTAAATVNGKYRYGSSGGIPTQTFNSTNYFVDIIFVPAA